MLRGKTWYEEKITAARTPTAADTQAQLVNMVHQVWLAGLGAASRAQQGAPKLLEELVAEGAQVQADTKRRPKKRCAAQWAGCRDAQCSAWAKCAATPPTRSRISRISFRARVHGALTQSGVPSAGEVQSLSKRVDSLNANIDRLARAKVTPAARAAKERDRHTP